MATRKETGEVEIRLSTEQAQKRIRELETEARKLEKAIDAAATGEPGKRDALYEMLEKNQAEVQKLRESMKTDMRIIINGEVAGQNIKNLENALKQLQREFRAVGGDDAALKQKAAQIAVIKAEIDRLKQPLKDAQIQMQNFGDPGSIVYLESEIKQLNEELRLLAPGTQEFIEKAQLLSIAESELQKVSNAVKETKQAFTQLNEPGSLNQLNAELNKLQTELAQLTPGTQAFIDKAEEVALVKTMIGEVNEQVKAVESSFTSLGQNGSIAQLENKVRTLNAELNKLTPGTDAFVNKTKELVQTEKQLEEVRKEISNVKDQFKELGSAGSLNVLQGRVTKLREEIGRLAPGTQEFITKTKELQQVEKQVKNLNNTISGQTGIWNSLSTQVKQFGVLAAGYLGFQALSSQITNVISKNAELSDSIAEIRMTTGMSAKEVDELNASFKRLDTRTATTELREIAKIAGQFGVPKEEILSFTDAMNKSVVVLKSEFSGGAEEITTKLATLRNVMSDFKTANISKDLTHLGNALVVLAQQGVATAPVITDFSNRIGGMGIPLGLSSGQVLGISATLQELGITAERGGTAVGRILQKMTTNTAEFAKIAGADLASFKEKVNTNLIGAFDDFLKGTQRFNGDALAMGGALKELETTGGGVTEVLAKLSNNTSLLNDRINTASQALKENAAITEQYELKNNNLAGQIDRLQKNLYALATSRTLSEWMAAAVEGTNKLITAIGKLPEFISKNSSAFFALAAAIAIYYANIIRATIATAANMVATVAWRGAAIAANAIMIALDVAIAAYSLTVGVLTGRITLAAAAQRIWNAVMAINPVGLFIAGLAAAVIAIDKFTTSAKQAMQLEIFKADITKRLAAAQEKFNKTQEEFGAQVQNINTLLPEQRKELERNIKLKIEDAKATLEQLTAEQKRIGELANKATIWQSAMNFLSHPLNWKAAAEADREDGKENAKKEMAKYAPQIIDLNNKIKSVTESTGELVSVNNAFANAMKINVRTIDQYNDKLNLLNKALNASVKGSAEYKKILAEIENTKKAFGTNDAVSTGGEVKYTLKLTTEEAEKQMQEFKRKMQTLQEELSKLKTSAIADDIEREAVQMQQAYEQSKRAALQKEEELIAEQIRIRAENIADVSKAEAAGVIRKSEAVAKKLQIEQTYNDNAAQIHETGLQLQKQLDEKYERDTAEFVKRTQDDLRKVEYQADISNLEKWQQEKNLLLALDYAKGTITHEQYEQQKADIDQRILALRLQYAKDYGRDLTTEEKAIVDAKIAEALREANARKTTLDKVKDYESSSFEGRLAALDAAEQQEIESVKGNQEAINAIHQHYSELRVKLIQEEVGKWIGIAQQMFNAYSDMQQSSINEENNRENAQFNKEKALGNKKKEEYKRMLDAKLISQDDYNSKVEAIDKVLDEKQRRIKRDQWERQHDADILQAETNAILAIARAFVDYQWPYSLIVAALIGATAYMKVSELESQTPPEFKYGKEAGEPIKKQIGGIVYGPSHEDGGIDLIDSQTGEKLGSMEGKEMIVGEKAVEANPEIAQLLMKSSKQGGVKIDNEEIYKIVEKYIPEAKRITTREVPDSFSTITEQVSTQHNTAHGRPDISTSGVQIDDDDFATRVLSNIFHPVEQVNVPRFVERSARVPQIDTQSIVDSIQVSRLGYATALPVLPEQRPTQQQKEDMLNITGESKDIAATLKQLQTTMAEMKTAIDQAKQTWEKPFDVKAKVVLRDLDEARRLEETAKRNARIG